MVFTHGPRWCAAWFLIAAFGLPATCAKPPPLPSRPPAPVVVAPAIAKSVPIEINTIGAVRAYATVSIKPRVSGQIVRVGFQEGQEVKKGDLLFEIDPRPFDAALKQAKANLRRDLSFKRKADLDVVRYRDLAKSRTVAEEVYEEVRTKAETLNAICAAGEAAVDAAAVQLDYCTIRSPINGRAGDLRVDEGNLIKGEDAPPLVTITQIRPIYVAFHAAEVYLPEIRKYMAQRTLSVDVTTTDKEKPIRGELTFLDNTVDRTTGTILLKATFANEDRELWPGQFVDVTLVLTTFDGAIVVPAEAVQTGQQGQYVFIVEENKAQMRTVVPGMQIGEEKVIRERLKAGEIVVTDGQLRLTPGCEVEIIPAAATGEGSGP